MSRNRAESPKVRQSLLISERVDEFLRNENLSEQSLPYISVPLIVKVLGRNEVARLPAFHFRGRGTLTVICSCLNGYQRGIIPMKKPFSICVYLIIVFGLSWPWQLWYVFRAESAFEKYGYSSLAMVMVGVATFIAGRFVFKDGFAGEGWRWGKPGQHLAVVAFACFVWLVPCVIEAVAGIHKPVGEIVATTLLSAFALRFVATFLPAFGEEFGWRGYLLPRLVERHGARKGLLLHAFIWWFWHLPAVIGIGLKTNYVGTTTFINVALLIAITLIPAMLHAVIFAYIWAKTESILVVSVYHAAVDEVRDALENGVGFGPLVEVWQMVVIILAGGWLLWKADWKKLLHEPVHAGHQQKESHG